MAHAESQGHNSEFTVMFGKATISLPRVVGSTSKAQKTASRKARPQMMAAAMRMREKPGKPASAGRNRKATKAKLRYGHTSNVVPNRSAKVPPR
mmetsp:Transcript_13649/g.20793  ORF Transcript_13649/g.20793 Transcript_13649/m.20793 type:complete len:94 (-) Transcript_13649:233-514(-)